MMEKGNRTDEMTLQAQLEMLTRFTRSTGTYISSGVKDEDVRFSLHLYGFAVEVTWDIPSMSYVQVKP